MVYLALWTTAWSLPLSESLKQVFFVAALILWVTQMLGSRQVPRSEPLLGWALLGYVISTLISALHAPRPGLALRGVWDVVLSTGVFFLALASCTSKRRIASVLSAILLSMGLGDLVGLYQYLTTDRELSILSLGDPRATAQYLAMVLALQSGLSSRRLLDPALRPIVWGTMPLTILALIFSYARGMWISVACVLLVYWWLQRQWTAPLLGATVLGMFLLAIWFSDPIQLRVESLFQNPLKDGSLQSRFVAIWPTAIQMIRDHPVLGLGPEAFAVEEYRVHYRIREAGGNVNSAHNLWLQIGVETGLVGLFSFVVVLGALGYVVSKAKRHLSDELTAGLWYGVVGCLVVVLVGGLPGLNWSAETSMIVMLLAGLFCASYQIDGTP